MKRFLLIVLAIVALCFVSLLLVPKRYLNTIAEEALIAEAYRHRMRAQFENFELTGSSFRATRMQLFSSPLLLGVECDAPEAALSLLPLLSGTLDGALRCNPYTGTLDARWNVGFDGRTGKIQLDTTELMLGEHPQFAALGFTGGALTIKDGLIEFADNRVAGFSAQTTLNKLARKTAFTLSDYIPNALPITVPAFENFSVRSTFAMEGQTMRMEKLEISSDWGRAVGDFQYTPSTKAIEGQIQISLTDAGVQFLGPYLPLLPPGGIAATERRVRLKVSGRLPLPRIEARRI